jgi:TonB family protein
MSGGTGAGADYGTPNGIGEGGVPLVSFPRLLNLDEVLKNLRRFYPESERRAGHEGQVLVGLHIGTDGRVGSVDVLRSAGPAFDAAAQAVGRLMLFSPALSRSGPVAVRMRQTMVFQLKDE